MDLKGITSRIKRLGQINAAPRYLFPKSGIHHYERNQSGEQSRIHLRVDPDETGVVMVNANRIAYLNDTAVLMAHLYLEQVASAEAIRAITGRYKIRRQQADLDYTKFISSFEEFVRPDGACPIHELDFEIQPPFSSRPSAPYRMDLALTYRCNNNCAHCYNARSRDYPELSTESWMRIIDLLWEIGIPHVVFTGGEPTMRNDLPELIAYASKTGQITGLNTNGRRLSDQTFLQNLVEAGLDHVQITLESHDQAIHDHMVAARGAWKQTVAGLRNALDSPLFVMTNTTMLTENSPFLAETLSFLSAEGVPTVGLNALIYSGRGREVGTGLREAELAPLLELASLHTSGHGQRLIWYTPTQYCNFDPMQLELGVKGCTAALYNMCIEADGAVLPCQSYYQPLGNILQVPWSEIWNHPLAVSLRERHDLPVKCQDCSLLKECGGGCPLYRPAD